MSFTLLGILNSQAAGGGGAAFDLLETTTLTSSSLSVTFSGLDSYATDYKHLQLRMVTRGTTGLGSLLGCYVTINGVTTDSYASHRLYGNGSSVIPARSTSQPSMRFDFITPNNDESNVWGAGVMDILDFSSTSKNTTIRFLNGAYMNAQKAVQLGSGLFNSTSAVTSIQMEIAAEDYAIGSRFSLYGVK